MPLGLVAFQALTLLKVLFRQVHHTFSGSLVSLVFGSEHELQTLQNHYSSPEYCDIRSCNLTPPTFADGTGLQALPKHLESAPPHCDPSWSLWSILALRMVHSRSYLILLIHSRASDHSLSLPFMWFVKSGSVVWKSLSPFLKEHKR